MTLSWQQVLSHKYQYQQSKYQYKYQYLACKYKYKYQYPKIVLKYRSSTSTSTQYNKTAKYGMQYLHRVDSSLPTLSDRSMVFKA